MARLLQLRISLLTAFFAALALALGVALIVGRGGGSNTNTPTVPSASGTGSTAAAVTPAASSTNAASVYNATHQGVVSILSTTNSNASDQTGPFGFGGNSQSTALGSGIVLDNQGDILTNEHVVDGANKVTVSFDTNPSTTRTGTVVGTDSSNDLAVVKIDPSGLNLHPLTLGDSDAAKVGDTVYALGNPFGYTNSFSEGIVSGLDRSITAPNGFGIDHAIQTDAAINPGNSGGPLLDASGQVIGINAQIASNQSSASGEGQNDGVGFAIPINTAKSEISQLEKNGHVSHAFLGVSTTSVAGSLQGSLTGAQYGALVESVQSGSPADNAGLRAGNDQRAVDGNQVALGGDVIQAVDGRRVNTSDDLAAAIGDHKPGDKVQLQIRRNGKPQTLTVTLGTQPSQAPNG
jgi:S1-C subfamily serine protease